MFTAAPFRHLVIEQCNILVCTYSMKWQFLEPEPGQFDFRRADRYVDFAQEHGMAFRGHTLVWERSTPAWLRDEIYAKGFSAVERHIRGVVGHYAGRLHSWDVVNEAIRPEDGRADRLKSNFFLETLGPSYIEAAFAVAREADPAALLYYNANPAPYRRERNREHFEGVIALLERLLSRDLPVQGVGLQGHLAAAYADEFDEATLVWFYERASALGLAIMITELDVSESGSDGCRAPGPAGRRDVPALFRRDAGVSRGQGGVELGPERSLHRAQSLVAQRWLGGTRTALRSVHAIQTRLA